MNIDSFRSPELSPDPSLADVTLLDIMQRQTVRYFWEGGHPVSGLARDRLKTAGDRPNDLIAIGGLALAS